MLLCGCIPANSIPHSEIASSYTLTSNKIIIFTLHLECAIVAEIAGSICRRFGGLPE